MFIPSIFNKHFLCACRRKSYGDVDLQLSMLCCINVEVKVALFVGKLLSKVGMVRRSGKMDRCSVVKNK